MRVLFTTLVLLYLALDLSDPTLPGAHHFDLADSVEVVQAARTAAPALGREAMGPAPVLAVVPGPTPPPAVARPLVPPVPVGPSSLHLVRRSAPERAADPDTA